MDPEMITKEEFMAYRKLQLSGKINMTDINRGPALAGISEEAYITILWNYKMLKDKWLS